jgi:hypothetical protein
MGRNRFDYSHADVGSEPVNALNFKKGERPKAGHFDWFWYSVIQAINAHADEFDELDSDDDGVVNEADKVDGWDKADIKTWVGDSANVPNADQANNADKVDGKDYTDIQNWVNNSSDVPNADHADSADDASRAVTDGSSFDVQDTTNGKTVMSVKESSGDVDIAGELSENASL